MSIFSQLTNKVFSQLSPKAILAILAVAILVVGGGSFALVRYIRHHLGRPEQKLQEINTVIHNVVSKNNLVTACYYEDLVVSGTKELLHETVERNKKGKVKKGGNDEMVLVQGAVVRAGFDMDQMDENSFRVEGDSAIFITLPEPVILKVVKDIESYEEFTHSGNWSYEQVKELSALQSKDLEKNALDSGLLDRAYTNGMNFFTSLFSPFGYNVFFARALPAPEPTPEVAPEPAQ